MRLILLFFGLPLLALNAVAEPDLHTVAHVDLSRYMGRWYVISHTPNFLERNKVGTSDNYALQPDGTIEDTFVFRKGSLSSPEKSWRGPAHVVDTATNAVWKVRLIWPFIAGYHVLELDPEYRWVAVCTDHGKLLWVMARDTTLPGDAYRGILARLAARGFEVDKLEKVPQRGGG